MAWGAAYNEALSPTGNEILSVSEFLDIVSELISPLKVTIQGEITEFDIRGTNVFGTISDTKGQAKLKIYIYKPLLDRLGIVLEQGMEVLLQGIPTIYKPNGNFSMRVSSVSLVGEGRLKAAYDRLIDALRTEGLFDERLKRPIPDFPVNIGVVSSATGDALQDFRKHLLPFNLKIHFADARVEGVNSVESVVEALRQLNESTQPLDVIVLTRGGGSLESLQAFNSEPVARAIRASRVPVISAIGHEQDITISDLVADLRASTPTDAAKRLSYNWSTALEQVLHLEESIISNFRKSFIHQKQRQDEIMEKILNRFQHAVLISSSKIKEAQTSAGAYLQSLQFLSAKFETDFHHNTKAFSTKLSLERNAVKNYVKALQSFGHGMIRHNSSVIDNLEQSILSNDPHNRLKQGYSIVTDISGKVIKDVNNVGIGDEIHIKVYKGELNTKIIDKK
jgi:exodeoxyribonuclease VII large subunit